MHLHQPYGNQVPSPRIGSWSGFWAQRMLTYDKRADVGRLDTPHA